jgi:hypothetical protein
VSPTLYQLSYPARHFEAQAINKLTSTDIQIPKEKIQHPVNYFTGECSTHQPNVLLQLLIVDKINTHKN